MHLGSILLCVIIYIYLLSTFKSLLWILATTMNCDIINMSVIIGRRAAIKLSETAERPFSTASVEKKTQKNKLNLDPVLRNITQVSIAANQSRVNIV